MLLCLDLLQRSVSIFEGDELHVVDKGLGIDGSFWAVAHAIVKGGHDLAKLVYCP